MKQFRSLHKLINIYNFLETKRIYWINSNYVKLCDVTNQNNCVKQILNNV